MNITDHTIENCRQLLDDGSVTSVELVEYYKDQIDEDNTNAVLELYDDAKKQAKAADTRRQDGEVGSLAGVPIVIKDNMLLEGETVSAGSKILKDYTATYTATALKRLQDAGAVIVGRTNMDEFAMGSSTEHSAFGPTKNPHDHDRVPGGSSGGSAAAVAGNLIPAALGSDTGGSVRQPASFCGCVGLKPTYGGISRFGLIAMGSSLDQIGPITNSVADTRLLFEIMRGQDDKDSTTITKDTYDEPGKDPETIGVPQDLLDHDGVSEDVRSAFKQTIDELESAGYDIVDVSLEGLSEALAVYYIIMPAEVSSNLARYDGVNFGNRLQDDDLMTQYINTRRDGFGEEVTRRILLGTYVLSAGYYDAYYRTAVRAREAIKQEFAEVFADVDVIATPTSPTVAFPLDDKTDDPLAMYAQDIFTVSANIAGIPALSVPAGSVKDESDLPVGFQLQAPHGHEEVLFTVGADVESVRS
jgi:aspartyl-tRNA(Asn)/glutamyl-tRNA(Gln) amidotransferase subunit A